MLISSRSTFSSITFRPQHMLFFALMANACGHAFFLISFPMFGRTQGLSDPQTGMVMGLSALVMTLASPVWGMICERWGRRPVLLTGLLTATLTLCAIALVLNLRAQGMLLVGQCFMLLLLFRSIGTSGIAAVMPSAQAYVADVTPRDKRVSGMGLLGASFGCGSVLGSGIAMVCGISDIWIGFMLVIGVLILACTVVARFLTEPERPPSTADTGSMQIRKMGLFLLITFLGLAAYSLVQQVTTLRLQDSFGLNADLSVRYGGAAMMSSMLLMILTQALLLPRLRWKSTQVLQRGALLCVVALVTTLSPSLPLFILAIALLGMGFGLLMPANLGLLSLNSSPECQARNAGINGIAQGLGMAVGPITGASLQTLSPSFPWIAACVLMLCILLIGGHIARQS